MNYAIKSSGENSLMVWVQRVFIRCLHAQKKRFDIIQILDNNLHVIYT